jgi:diguanylate cyclase (GGDEF)-like protein
MQHMAQYDGLTALPNRKLFLDRLGQAIELARRGGTSLALLYFDLDRFKPVNDLWGHEAGDLLLKEVAERVLEIVRKSDTVARFGGDEFVILLQGIGLRENAGWVAAELREALAYPFVVEGVMEELRIGASIGIAYYPEDALTGDELIRLADARMYLDKAKQSPAAAAGR